MAKGTGKRLAKGALAAAWAWLVLVVAYIGWGSATGSGLYGWLMRWQLEGRDSYSATLTFVLPILLLGLPSIWLLFGHFAAAEQEAAGSPELEQRHIRRWAFWTLGLAGTSLAAGIGCAVMAAQQPSGTEAPIEIDAAELAAGRAPPGRLRMMARPDPAARYEITQGNRRMGSSKAAWQGFHPEGPRRRALEPSAPLPAGVPIALFYTGRSSGGSDGQLAETIQVTGRLVEGGLPEVARRGLAERGVMIAEPHYLLSDEEPGSGWGTGALLGFFFAFALGVIGGALLVRAKGRIGARR